MKDQSYNYSTFSPHPKEFEDFAKDAPKATERAPSVPLEDLDTGAMVAMKDLWKTDVALIEFGSFT
jgi:hypothetical protein